MRGGLPCFGIKIYRRPAWYEFCIMNLLLLCFLSFLFADDFSDNRKKQADEFAAYRKRLQSGIKEQESEFSRYTILTQAQFAKWQEEQKREYGMFRDSIQKEWGAFIEPTNKKWVEYGKDTRTVSIVDFFWIYGKVAGPQSGLAENRTLAVCDLTRAAFNYF